MNVVRFRLKPDYLDKYFKVIGKTNSEGMTESYISKKGAYDYCFVGIWEGAASIAYKRTAMLSHLDEVRCFMKELSPELGVTETASGNIFSKVGFHDR